MSEMLKALQVSLQNSSIVQNSKVDEEQKEETLGLAIKENNQDITNKAEEQNDNTSVKELLKDILSVFVSLIAAVEKKDGTKHVDNAESYSMASKEPNKNIGVIQNNAKALDEDGSGVLTMQGLYSHMEAKDNEIARIFDRSVGNANKGKGAFEGGYGFDLAMFRALGGEIDYKDHSKTTINLNTLVTNIAEKLDTNQDGHISDEEIDAFRNSQEYKDAEAEGDEAFYQATGVCDKQKINSLR